MLKEKKRRWKIAHWKFMYFFHFAALLPILITFRQVISACLAFTPTYFYLLYIRKQFRPWDYPENFGIYSQLNSKRKTCFFTFLNVYISWIKRGKILISPQPSPAKFKYFVDQNGKWGPYENEFWQFSSTKTSFLNS